MPASSRWPRTTATATSSPPCDSRRSASASSSVAHQRSWPPQSIVPARPDATSSSHSACHSGCGGISTSEHRRSWRSSLDSGCGVISACTAAIASGSRRPIAARSTERPRRICTAFVRRFCASSSSRNAYGRAVRISCASTDGSVVSTVCTRTVARFHALEQLAQPVDVEPFVQRVVHRLAHDHVVGDLHRSDPVVLAGRGLREHGRHHVVGFHALDRRRVAPTAAEAQHEQGTIEVPPPPRDEHRRVEHGLLQRLLDRPAGDVAGDFAEREAVVRPERQHDRVVARRGLQLEVEGAAELLAQREAERAVDPTTVRRVQHELHPARVVEEPLEDERVERRASRPTPRVRTRCSRRSSPRLRQ